MNVDVFGDIYNRNDWGATETVSGNAATKFETCFLRQDLLILINFLGIESITDVGCGDLNWMADILKNSRVKYCGVDVVPLLLDECRKRIHGGLIEFVLAHSLSDALPYGDLVICRNVMVHLSLENIDKLLTSIRKVGAKYVALTTFTDNSRENVDIVDGLWRPINLQKAPFNLTEPIYRLDEGYGFIDKTYYDRSLCVWEWLY